MALTLTVEIVCRETIKPSSPTPPSLRNYHLSHMDQISTCVYTPYLLFYSKSSNSIPRDTFDHSLKKSLSETLTLMYPLAGRVNVDHMSIDCNDHGVDYLETRVNVDMSTVLDTPKNHLLLQLLPLDPETTWRSTEAGTGNQVLVAVQVNHFRCGGLTISACIRHEIADASTASSFLQIWASFARGDGSAREYKGSTFVFPERTTIFPPFNNNNCFRLENRSGDPQVNKLLVFNGSKVSALKEKVGSVPVPVPVSVSNPVTRFEAVMVFLWAAIISAAQQRNPAMEIHSLVTIVNLRKKLNPPQPAHAMGNICHPAIALWEAWEGKVEYNVLMKNLRESIKIVTEDYVRQVHGDEEFINIMKSATDYMGVNGEYEAFGDSSWLRFPFYEVDFGWGKPVWLANFLVTNNAVLVLDRSDGAGIEAWIRMRKDDMEKLEQDPHFLACVSAIHTL